MRSFTEARRRTLRRTLDGAQQRGEIPTTAILELLIAQACGQLWYRLMVGHAPVDVEVAAELTEALADQTATA